jgi:hypothetical protein
MRLGSGEPLEVADVDEDVEQVVVEGESLFFRTATTLFRTSTRGGPAATVAQIAGTDACAITASAVVWATVPFQGLAQIELVKIE